MKKIDCLIVLVATIILAGCAVHRPVEAAPPDTRARFGEAAQADLMVDFNSWSYTYLTKPEVIDKGYRREVSTNEIALILGERHTPRKLAVVKLGWLLNSEGMQDAMARWSAVLQQLDFDRIVFVRPTGDHELFGAVIVRDTQLVYMAPGVGL